MASRRNRARTAEDDIIEDTSGPVEAGTRDDVSTRILRSIRRIIRAVEINSKKLSHVHGITSPQLTCLRKVIEEGEITTKDLAAGVYLSPSTVVGILDRLEMRSLIRRERSRVDRRIVYIRATDSGAALVAQAPYPMQERLSGALGELPELEQVSIALSLERLVDLLEIKGIDAAPILEPGVYLEPLQPIEPIIPSTDHPEPES